MILRDYQISAIEQVRNGLRQGHTRQILMLPVGSGKTAIAASMTKSAVAKGRSVWFIVDNLELVEQTIETFERFGIDVAVVQGDHDKTDYSKSVQVLTAQTLTRRWGIFDINPHWLPSLCFIDESHVQHKAHQEIINMLPRLPVIGLSATPFSKGLGLKYSRLINVVSTSDLIEQGYLNEFEAYGFDTPDMQGTKTQSGDYVTSEAHKKVKKIVGNIVKTWLKVASDRKTIVFACNIAHSKELAAEFNAFGVAAIHLDGFTDKNERRVIIERFKKGEIPVLCSVMVLVKGFDAPICDCAILAAPTKSLMKHRQSCGRSLRSLPGKKKTLFLDHAGNFQRLGFPDDPETEYLCNGDKNEIEKRKQEKKEKLPTACEKCSHLSVKYVCEICGHEPIKKTNVEVTEGKLKKLDRVDMNEKRRWYGEMLGYVRDKGWKDGKAYYSFKEKFGVFPTRTKQTVSIKPGSEVVGFMRHLQIKQSKRVRND